MRVAQRNPRQRLYHPAARRRSASSASIAADITKPDSVRHALSTARPRSINLCGVFGGNMRGGPCRWRAQRRRGRREAGARMPGPYLARSAPTRQPQSAYGRTKGEGEAAVREAFPSATIIRPSLVFGPEDNLTNRFAAMARLPVPSGDRRQAQLPAGLCARPRRGDRHGRARSADATAARPTRLAGRRR